MSRTITKRLLQNFGMQVVAKPLMLHRTAIAKPGKSTRLA
jgi:hypothetical protein